MRWKYIRFRYGDTGRNHSEVRNMETLYLANLTLNPKHTMYRHTYFMSFGEGSSRTQGILKTPPDCFGGCKNLRDVRQECWVLYRRFCRVGGYRYFWQCKSPRPKLKP